MITKSNLIFSIAAAGRILEKRIYEVRLLPFVVLVRGLLANGQKFCRFVSKRDFLTHFTDRRKKEAENVDLVPNTQDSSKFWAYSSAPGGKVYTLTKELRFITCSCEDYQNQQKFLQRGICKHGYSVLFYLGFSSLKEYVQRDHTVERVPAVEDTGLGYVTNKRSSSEPRRKGRSVD